MESVKEWSGRPRNVEEDSGSLVLGVNYSNFLQLKSRLCDSAVTVLSRSVSFEVPQCRLH